MGASPNRLPLSGGLEDCVDALNQLSAPQLDAAVQALLRPLAVCTEHPAAEPLPMLAALPLAAQTNLVLLLRAAPLRVSTAQRAALLGALARLPDDVPGASLLALLAADAGGGAPPVPPCPPTLFTSRPAFPWAPVLADPATAAAAFKWQQLEVGAAGEAAWVSVNEGDKQPAAQRQKRAGDGAAAASSPAKRQRQDAGDELGAAVAAIKCALAAHASGSAALSSVTPELSSALGTLLTAAAGGAAGTAALRESGLAGLQDDALLLLLLQDAVTPGSSFARCTAAARCLLLPRLQALDGSAPRDLAAAAEHVAAANPQAFLAACLQPLLSSPGLGRHQGELLTGTLKAALPAQLLPDALAGACAAPLAADGSDAVQAPAGSGWSEHTVDVLLGVLGGRPALPAGVVAQLAEACAAAAAASSTGLAASPKFGKLVLSLARQYPDAAAAAKPTLQRAAQACTSFMAKSLLAAVAKL